MFSRKNIVARLQIFQVTEAEDLQYHHISCQPEFVRYSPEELRCQAYGIRVLQEDPQPVSLAIGSASANVQASDQIAPSRSASFGVCPTSIPEEALESISANPLHIHHSHEEIRWAHLYTQQDLSSEQLFAFKPTPPPRSKGAEPLDNPLWRANLYSISHMLEPTQDRSIKRRFWEM